MDHYANAVRFEVLVNGDRRCIAGIPTYGVLSSTLDWAVRNPACKPESYTPEQWSRQRLRMSVGGLQVDGPGEAESKQLAWAFEDLKPGDEITVRVLGPGEFDAPLSPRENEDVG